MLENQDNGFKENMSTRIKLTVTKPNDKRFLKTGLIKQSIKDDTNKLVVPNKRIIEED